MLKLQTVNKLSVAQEIRDQTLKEAQEVSSALIAAEQRIGKLLLAIPKATPNNNPNHEKSDDELLVKPKSETIKEMGYGREYKDYQQMAKNPEIVQKYISDAIGAGQVPVKSGVLKAIRAPFVHVGHNSNDNEWYTPSKYIESARNAMGSIDLDPASNDFANETVKATTYFTEETNGLEQEWYGNVWLNPPYDSELIQMFADKLVSSNCEQAIVLVNNATETQWFKTLISMASAYVFTEGRIKFLKRDGEHATPLQGQVFLYFGNRVKEFVTEFVQYGWAGTGVSVETLQQP